MKKIIFGIFAHPDDEAFGCAGTLLTETRNGSELHLVTLTLGDAGTNPDNHEDLASIREQEWRRGGALMGAEDMQYLGFLDGRLGNQSMIEAGQKIVEIVRKATEDAPQDAEIEFITLDPNGLTGHIDHIVASRAASWAFYSLKESGLHMTRIRYVCAPRTELPESNISWLYMEAGRSDDEINEIVDARRYHDEILTIVRAHVSQRGDGESLIEKRGAQLGMNYFMVKK